MKQNRIVKKSRNKTNNNNRSINVKVNNGRVIRKSAKYLISRKNYQQEFHKIFDCGRFIHVYGLPYSGKRTFVSNFIDDQKKKPTTLMKLNSSEVIVICIDLEDYYGPNAFTRSLLDNFDTASDFARSLMDGHAQIYELEYATIDSMNVKEKISTILTHSINLDQETSLIMVVFHPKILDRDEFCLESVGYFLDRNIMSNGAAIVVDNSIVPSDFGATRLEAASLSIEGLQQSEFEELFRKRELGNLELKGLYRNLLEKKIKELFLPGVVGQGIAHFNTLPGALAFDVAEDRLSYSITSATGRVVMEVIASLGFRVHRDLRLSSPEFVSLLCAAVLAEFPMQSAKFRDVGLKDPPWTQLLRFDWCKLDGDGWNLTGAGRDGLRGEIARSYGGKSDADFREPLLNNLKTIVDSILSTPPLLEGIGRRLEKTLSWIASEEIYFLHDFLKPYLGAYGAPLAIAALSESDYKSGYIEINKDKTTSKLNLCFRSAYNLHLAYRFEQESEKFVYHFQMLLKNVKDIDFMPSELFDLIDVSLFKITTSCRVEIRKIIDYIFEFVEVFSANINDETCDLARRLSCLSCLLNTAKVFLLASYQIDAEQMLGSVNAALESIRSQSSNESVSGEVRVFILSLSARFHEAKAQTTEDVLDRISELRRALEAAEIIVNRETHAVRWMFFYLRRVRHLMQEIPDAGSRDTLITECSGLVTSLLGEDDRYIPVIGYMGALIRLEASMQPSSVSRLERFRLAVAFLQKREASLKKYSERTGDVRPLLALVRALRSFAHSKFENGDSSSGRHLLDLAIKLAEKTVSIANSPAEAWDVLLRTLALERNVVEPAGCWWGQFEEEEIPSTDNRILTAMQECEQWLADEGKQGEKEAKLAAWCQSYKWHIEGSLERLALGQASRPVQKNQEPIEWKFLPNPEKVTIINRLNNTRTSKTKMLVHRFGRIIDIEMLNIRNEIQFRRTIANYTDHKMSLREINRLFDSYKEEFFPSWKFLYFEAAFRRYVWDFKKAIALLRQADALDVWGDDRRQIQLLLAETLVTSALHNIKSLPPERVQKTDEVTLREASSICDHLKQFYRTKERSSFLADHIDLELGENLDWDKINHAYDSIFGDYNDYLYSVSENINELTKIQIEIPSDISESLLKDFTDLESLKHFGLIHLRKGEIMNSLDGIPYLEKAYIIFSARAMLQRSWGIGEHIVTNFHISRAIIVGCLLKRELNPFPSLISAEDGLAYAQGKLNTAINRSVGSFRFELKKMSREAGQLKRKLSR